MIERRSNRRARNGRKTPKMYFSFFKIALFVLPIIEGYRVVETNNCSLEEIVKFVVKENYLHHQKNLPKNISEEIEELIKEEQRLLLTSKFFVAKEIGKVD